MTTLLPSVSSIRNGANGRDLNNRLYSSGSMVKDVNIPGVVPFARRESWCQSGRGFHKPTLPARVGTLRMGAVAFAERIDSYDMHHVDLHR